MWEIRDGRFWLVSLRGRFRFDSDEPVLADWFTGVLRIPRGDMLAYVHMGFGSVYEEELHIAIERGVVTRTEVIDNKHRNLDLAEIERQNLPGGESFFAGDDLQAGAPGPVRRLAGRALEGVACRRSDRGPGPAAAAPGPRSP